MSEKQRVKKVCERCRFARMVTVRDFGTSIDGVKTPNLSWPKLCSACSDLNKAEYKFSAALQILS